MKLYSKKNRTVKRYSVNFFCYKYVSINIYEYIVDSDSLLLKKPKERKSLGLDNKDHQYLRKFYTLISNERLIKKSVPTFIIKERS
jgi:hypothetical protein